MGKRHKLLLDILVFRDIQTFLDVGSGISGKFSPQLYAFCCEAVCLFGFIRYSRVRENYETSFPCRAEVVVDKSVAALLAHTQVSNDLVAG